MEKELPLKESLVLCIRSDEGGYDGEFLPVIARLNNLSEIKFVTEKQDGVISFMVQTTEFYIPLGDRLDPEKELSKITEELKYYKGFLVSVMKKLDNERFIQNAPAEVLELERKKKSDAEMKIGSLEARIRELKSL
jgi:valyl-tRNA synthetase